MAAGPVKGNMAFIEECFNIEKADVFIYQFMYNKRKGSGIALE